MALSQLYHCEGDCIHLLPHVAHNWPWFDKLLEYTCMNLCDRILKFQLGLLGRSSDTSHLHLIQFC
ncbi:hypothetical protein BDV37DRAFT_267194 [Aspergillus pseudonomiae]|uniref:Uncharacterized protein n=1 Tax=Aspergillus pseudonomiae TaxID=1506151 RepID=A0A5N7CTB1_9EURO|nr:uncharacterized protein BDV37DRAFT_267194 [Aspergillus pseudonomiae]KAE8396868.1 hypothetical protein BDV37DRAFT_267194 [Aspergillus pseudonomiae]